LSMSLRSLLQAWLHNKAKAAMRDAVMQAEKGQDRHSTEKLLATEPKPCHIGLVFALGIESGCFEDLLQGAVAIRGHGFTVREGGLRGRRVVLIRSMAGQSNAARATEILIAGHRPSRIISAGLAGGLSAELKRNDILVADRLLRSDGDSIAVELPPALATMCHRPGVRCGTLLSADRVVRFPSQRRELLQRHGAMAVDMETFAVAEVCRRHGIPFSSIRAINDTADETLPNDVEHLLAQKTTPARLGAAMGAILRRPASAKDMYRLRENALVASLRLAEFIASIAASI
jgi:adenosylhomocysteine nucleosidase